MADMPLDSAWRQYRRALDTAETAEAAAKACAKVWKTVLLQEFTARYRKADELGHDVQNRDILASLGLPCIDCQAPVPAHASGHDIVYNGRNQDFPVWAECGKAAPDPRTIDMPTLPTTPLLDQPETPL